MEDPIRCAGRRPRSNSGCGDLPKTERRKESEGMCLDLKQTLERGTELAVVPPININAFLEALPRLQRDQMLIAAVDTDKRYVKAFNVSVPALMRQVLAEHHPWEHRIYLYLAPGCVARGDGHSSMRTIAFRRECSLVPEEQKPEPRRERRKKPRTIRTVPYQGRRALA